MMIVKPSTTHQTLLHDNFFPIFSDNVFFKFKKLAKPEKYFLFDHFDLHFHNVNSVFEHFISPLSCPKDSDLGQQIKNIKILNKLTILQSLIFENKFQLGESSLFGCISLFLYFRI